MANTPDTIIIVCGGILQIPAVEEAKKLGLKTIVTDRDPNAPCRNLADEFYVLDIYDVKGHVKLVRKLKKENNIKGVFTEGSEATISVAAAANELGLPSISIRSAINCRDKTMTRRILSKAKIPMPRWKEITSRDNLSKAVKEIGFPLIIKAGNNSASRGSTKLWNEKGVIDAYNLAKRNSSNDKVIVEELCEGYEQSVEILFDKNKKCTYLNIVDRFFSKNKWSIELGHVNPSNLSPKEKMTLFKITQEAAKAMGINFGVFKADTMMTKRGPIVLEVTPRLSGGFDSQKTTPISSGRNFIRAAMMLSVGLPIDKKDLRHKWKKYASVWTVLSSPGVVTKIDGLKTLEKINGIKEIILIKKIGNKILPMTSSAVRPAYIISEGSSYQEALNLTLAGSDLIKYRVK
ncbi:ATP-grasp domain-containing protein [Candidatus Nitrosotalea okcheonensis]|uniref:ATP-grasp domain-containing protein n=1 Tax=Candidatus Nitrosotalea okcheonensis TaxID=1903276 RepID=A0A2H1FHT7_9ARCH|nr:ATP-grasp domain-containing protein [Candidatus Nitrosotalea okcheonensis]SMH72317.1 conserved protein of unknown function [Candidatus Nitrosotalea okcheonensis]